MTTKDTLSRAGDALDRAIGTWSRADQMTLGPPVKVRLNPVLQAELEREAAHRKLPLATYLRERLRAGSDALVEIQELRQELTALRRMVEVLAARQAEPAAAATGATDPALLELLLLMRTTATPDRLRVAQAELRRLGMEPWKA